MMAAHRFTVDLVTKKPDGTFVLVLVEQGPWNPDILEQQLRRLQDRLYDSVDAAIDGHVAATFPDSEGKPMVIRVNCYDVPGEVVAKFMERFINHVAGSAEIQRALIASGFLSSLSFEYKIEAVGADNE